MTTEELLNLAKTEQVEIIPFNLEEREALSLMDPEGRCYIGINQRMIRSGADEKTKLAHELGHCATGSFYCIYSPYDLRMRHEVRADKWAIHKLIPETELNDAVKKGYTTTWDLAERFGVTEEFMHRAIQLYKLGRLSD